MKIKKIAAVAVMLVVFASSAVIAFAANSPRVQMQERVRQNACVRIMENLPQCLHNDQLCRTMGLNRRENRRMVMWQEIGCEYCPRR